MAVLPAWFTLFLYFHNVFGYAIVDDGEDLDEIVWPLEYYFKGERLELYSDTNEPFEIWYSAQRNRSREALNHGADQTYYLADKSQKLVVYPTTTGGSTSELYCEQSTRDGEQFDFLPSTEGFVYSGQATVADKQVGVWKHEEHEKVKLRTETVLYAAPTDSGEHIPVQVVKKELDLANGQVVSHQITNYYGFSDDIEDSDFEVDVAYCEEVDEESENSEGLRREFRSFRGRHGRRYGRRETRLRRNIFERNWRLVEEHNRSNSSFRLALNEFSDWTPEELRALKGLRLGPGLRAGVGRGRRPGAPFPRSEDELAAVAQDLPDSLDLRFEGYISPVKSQGACGSCWAFTMAAVLEGAAALAGAGARLLDLSEQALVDCAWDYDNYGCRGGHLETALEYVEQHGIPKEIDYGEYIQNDGFCELGNASAVRIQGFVAVTARSAAAVKAALRRYGPVAAAIHAGDRLTAYHSGVYYDPDCSENTPANHAVTIVGYGSRDGADYWVVKNSWGARWGQAGYVLMAAAGNNCGLLDTPYAVIV